MGYQGAACSQENGHNTDYDAEEDQFRKEVEALALAEGSLHHDVLGLSGIVFIGFLGRCGNI